MNQADSIYNVEKRAEAIRQTATSEHYVYLHAINDFMSEQRKVMSPERADHLQSFLLRKFGME